MRVATKISVGLACFSAVALGAVYPTSGRGAEGVSVATPISVSDLSTPSPSLVAANADGSAATRLSSTSVVEDSPRRLARVALQAGHWKAEEAPYELRRIRTNGTRWESVAEWEVNLDIAERAATQLRELGYEVDVLPAVVPPGYRADLFIAVHADGAASPAASGYRVAASRRDRTGRGEEVASLLSRTYGEVTGLRHLPTNTRRMTNYYAFNNRRYQHSIDPETIGIIIETGFLTSPGDRAIIVDDPDRAARGIVAAVTAFGEHATTGSGNEG